jgi:hypothetical protein
MKEYKEYLVIGLIVLVAVFVGVFAARFIPTSQLTGDFPQGIVPSQLLTVNSANGGVTPIGSFSFGFGGTAPANQIVTAYTATTSYPAATVALGTLTSSTSTTSTVVTFSAPGFSVGDACEVAYNGTTSTLPFGADAFVTAVNGTAVTSTVTFWNGAASSITLTPTSSATGASSTLKTTCFHTGV